MRCACSVWLAISRLLASSFGMTSRASMFENATVYLSAFLNPLQLSGEQKPVLSSPRSMFPSSLCYAAGRAAVRFRSSGSARCKLSGSSPVYHLRSAAITSVYSGGGVFRVSNFNRGRMPATVAPLIPVCYRLRGLQTLRKPSKLEIIKKLPTIVS